MTKLRDRRKRPALSAAFFGAIFGASLGATGCGAPAASHSRLATEQSASTAQGFFLHENDTVVFFGDSISSLYDATWPTWDPPVYPPSNGGVTENYTYCMDIVSWATTQMPGSNINFYDMAVPGETTSGDEWPTNGPHQTNFAPGYGGDIASHLAYIESLNPTVVTVDLGMNDGEYIANNSTLDSDFVNGIETIVSSLLAWSPSLRIVVLAPSYFDYDRRVATNWPADWAFDPNYNADVLQAFGAWEGYYVSTLNNPNVTFIDLNTPMAAASAGLAPGQSLTQEGIHPTWQGYEVIAATVLQSWGADPSTLQYPNIQSVQNAFVSGQANIWNGNQQYVWTGSPMTTGGGGGSGGSGGSSAAPVELTVADSQSLFWDSGNYQRGDTVLQVYPSYVPNSAQDWAWAASGGGFTVCNTSGSPCLSDDGGQVIMGSQADIITITETSAVYDLTTGHYFQSPASSAYGATVTTGSTQSAWTFSSSLH